jgi:hypothetical protein
VKRIVLVAALTTLACPQKRWYVEAQVPPAGKDQAFERVVHVTATREAQVDIGDDGNWRPASPVTPVTWPGTGTYVVPKGVKLGRVQITYNCGAGCSECVPPRDGSEYIRIDRIEQR